MKIDQLSRRERQIMEVLFRSGDGTVASVREAMPEPPSLNAVRTLIQILEEKGHLTRRKVGRQFVYSPRENPARVGLAALRKVVETFFHGSVEEALAAHFSDRKADLDAETLRRLDDLIARARDREEVS